MPDDSIGHQSRTQSSAQKREYASISAAAAPQSIYPTDEDKKMSETNCIFCKIASGQISSTKVYEDELACAFRDTNPQAPAHILLIPKKHIASLNDLTPEDHKLMGHLMLITRQIAQQENIQDKGFRVVVNTGEDGGQSVFHIHLHVMGGRPMAWPPG